MEQRKLYLNPAPVSPFAPPPPPPPTPSLFNPCRGRSRKLVDVTYAPGEGRGFHFKLKCRAKGTPLEIIQPNTPLTSTPIDPYATQLKSTHTPLTSTQIDPYATQLKSTHTPLNSNRPIRHSTQIDPYATQLKSTHTPLTQLKSTHTPLNLTQIDPYVTQPLI